MTDLTEKYHISRPVCKKEGFTFKKDRCLCIKKKTRKIKPKLKIIKGLESVKIPKKSKSNNKKPPSMENEPMHQMIMQTLQKKVKFPSPTFGDPNPVNSNQHLRKATPAKSKTAKKAKKRCPPGTIKNPKTGRCIKKSALERQKRTEKKQKLKIKETAKKESAKKESKKSNLENVLEGIVKVHEKQLVLKPARKRCPKGTRKNPKTGQCDPVRAATPKKKTTPIVVPSSTPAFQENLGNKIASILSNPYVKYKNQKISQSIMSFSPEINKKLVQKRKSPPDSGINRLTACVNFQDGLMGSSDPKVFVNGSGCKKYFSKQGQDTLLKALSYSRKNLNMDQVIAPKQEQSNCWFNTMFMVFFVSDKGRKFFKFFRQLMITGKKADGTIIKPPRLLRGFAYLNLAIEGSLTGAHSFDTFNTNLLIKQIYNGIPPKFRTKSIRSEGVANNPLNYYKGIMQYLHTDKVDLLNISAGGHVSNRPGEINDYIRDEILKYQNGIPDVLAIEISDNLSLMMRATDAEKQPELSFTQINGKGVKYKLDSSVIRDTTKKHFCALLEIGGKQCGFDGASFRKLSEFNWKELINSNKNWTFEGSTWEGTKDDILWNFKNGYQILFYYRV